MTDIKEFFVKIILRALMYGVAALLAAFSFTATDETLIGILTPIAAGLVALGVLIGQLLIDKYFHKKDIAKTPPAS